MCIRITVVPAYSVRCMRRSSARAGLSGDTSGTGVAGVRLYVERDNSRAQETYAALGMSETHYRMYEKAAAEF